MAVIRCFCMASAAVTISTPAWWIFWSVTTKLSEIAAAMATFRSVALIFTAAGLELELAGPGPPLRRRDFRRKGAEAFDTLMVVQ